MRRAAFALVLIFASGGAVAESATCARNAFEVFEEISCAIEAMKSADQELNRAYALLISKLSADEAASLRQSQRAWLKFLDAESQLAIRLEGDGSAGRLVVANLRERHIRARVAELKNWSSR